MSVTFQEEVITKFKKPAKYNVIALNNDDTAFDEVVYILVKAFSMSESVAAEITLKIDREGSAKCNPRPLSKGLAEVQLARANEVKVELSRLIPFRASQIMMLRFIVKED